MIRRSLINENFFHARNLGICLAVCGLVGIIFTFILCKRMYDLINKGESKNIGRSIGCTNLLYGIEFCLSIAMLVFGMRSYR